MVGHHDVHFGRHFLDDVTGLCNMPYMVTLTSICSTRLLIVVDIAVHYYFSKSYESDLFVMQLSSISGRLPHAFDGSVYQACILYVAGYLQYRPYFFPCGFDE